jgi:hypothetical protein
MTRDPGRAREYGMVYMEGWATDTIMLRLLTVAFIVAAAIDRSKISRFKSILALSAFATSIGWHTSASGAEGLLYSFSGVGVALIASYPLMRLKKISKDDLMISLALGSMLGLSCSAMVFLIAYAFLSMQALLRADYVLITEGVIDMSSQNNTDLFLLDEKSALAEIEALKILRSEGIDFEKHYLLTAYREDVTGVSPTRRYVNILPWPAKLAFGTLAVLMYGFPI